MCLESIQHPPHGLEIAFLNAGFSILPIFNEYWQYNSPHGLVLAQPDG